MFYRGVSRKLQVDNSDGSDDLYQEALTHGLNTKTNLTQQASSAHSVTVGFSQTEAWQLL